MNRKVFPICLILLLGLASCASPSVTGEETTAPETGVTSISGTVSKYTLPDDLMMRFTPYHIMAIPKSTVQIAGDTMDAYQVPGDHFRVVCKQPCALDEQTVEAAYTGYKLSIYSLVRLVGFDVLDKYDPVDFHLTRDSTCTRPSGEAASQGFYKDNPMGIVICLYLTEEDIIEKNSDYPPTAENAIRLGGLGAFSHEYIHAMLAGRFRASLHDFVFPIEWNTIESSDPYYGDLCGLLYSGEAPFTYQLCQSKGLTFSQLIQSMNDMNRLYEGGYGDMYGMVSWNQYLSVLENILDTDVRPVSAAVGYESFFSDESNIPYTLPYDNERCSYQAKLLSDVTIPLGTTMDINTPFEKIWQIENSGSCDWEGVQLAYVRGDAMTATTTVAVDDTPAGGTVEVSVPMTAPAEAGVYSGEWRLSNADGQDFGPIINLLLYTRPGCSFPPEFSYFMTEPQTIGRGALSLLSWGWVTNVDKLEIDGLGSVDLNGNRILVQPDQTTTYTLRATCGTNTVTTQATVTVDTNLPDFEISNVAAEADPADFSGECTDSGKQINFNGSFSSNGPGVVVYHWTRNDTSYPTVRVKIFDQAGTQTVKDYWMRWDSYSGWMEMKILAPVESDAVRGSFTLTCTD